MRGEDLVIGAAVIFMAISGFQKRQNRSFDKITKAYVIMGVVAILSISGSVLIFGEELIFGDWMILPLLVRQWVVYRMARNIKNNNLRLFCLKVALVAAALSSIVGLMQRNNIMNVNIWLTPYYISGGAKTVSLDMLLAEKEEGRIAGTNGDPRQYGFLLDVGIAVVLAIMFNLKNGRSVKILAAVTGSLAFAAIILSLSRTTIVSLFVILAGAFYLVVQSRKQVSQILPVVFVISTIGICIYMTITTDAFETRILTLESQSYEYSIHARKRDLLTPFYDALDNPGIWFLGRGPSKASLRQSTHNDFGWMFHRFGLPGLGFYIFLLWTAITQSRRFYLAAKTDADRVVAMAVFLSTLVWLVFSQAESVFKDTQLMVFSMFFLGLLYSYRSDARGKKSQARRVSVGALRNMPAARAAVAGKYGT